MTPVVVTGRLTQFEINQIAKLAEKGWSAGQIGKHLLRHPGTIKFVMTEMELRAALDPPAAPAHHRAPPPMRWEWKPCRPAVFIAICLSPFAAAALLAAVLWVTR